MNLSEIKSILNTLETVNFQLENGVQIPKHFHITEIGIITKHFIDCGGKVRTERKANFQLWNANDIQHRLMPQKLLNIIDLSEKALGIENLEIEIEYQSDTIGKYNLGFDGKNFLLLPKKTACLAADSCGTVSEIRNTELRTEEVCCSPGGACC